MDRFHHLHSVVRRESAGIEIGPWRHPVAPKRDGYRTTVIDILDTEALRAMARDRNVPAEEISLIEDVDIVGEDRGGVVVPIRPDQTPLPGGVHQMALHRVLPEAIPGRVVMRGPGDPDTQHVGEGGRRLEAVD